MATELTDEFVLAAHFNLERVRELLAANPELIHAERAGETALAAAAHVGQRAIAELLLNAGAPLDICCAAMLGRREAVASFLARDSKLALTKGAHGISLLFHVALGGDTVIADLVVAAGGGEEPDGAVHGAVAKGHPAMVEWLFSHGASDANVPNFQGKTPLRVATELGHAEIATALRARGGHE